MSLLNVFGNNDSIDNKGDGNDDNGNDNSNDTPTSAPTVTQTSFLTRPFHTPHSSLPQRVLAIPSCESACPS